MPGGPTISTIEPSPCSAARTARCRIAVSNGICYGLERSTQMNPAQRRWAGGDAAEQRHAAYENQQPLIDNLTYGSCERAADGGRRLLRVNQMTSKRKLILISHLCGVGLTFFMTVIAFTGDSREWGCTFAWQACLVQTVIHTHDNAMHEGSPIDLFGFAIGVLLGVPIYAGLSYVLLLLWQGPSAKTSS